MTGTAPDGSSTATRLVIQLKTTRHIFDVHANWAPLRQKQDFTLFAPAIPREYIPHSFLLWKVYLPHVEDKRSTWGAKVFLRWSSFILPKTPDTDSFTQQTEKKYELFPLSLSKRWGSQSLYWTVDWRRSFFAKAQWLASWFSLKVLRWAAPFHGH